MFVDGLICTLAHTSKHSFTYIHLQTTARCSFYACARICKPAKASTYVDIKNNTMHVSMYVCSCMYGCIPVHVSVCVQVRIYASIYPCMHVFYVCWYYLFKCSNTNANECAQMYTCMRRCGYGYLDLRYTDGHKHVLGFMHVFTQSYTYTCLCVQYLYVYSGIILIQQPHQNIPWDILEGKCVRSQSSHVLAEKEYEEKKTDVANALVLK